MAEVQQDLTFHFLLRKSTDTAAALLWYRSFSFERTRTYIEILYRVSIDFSDLPVGKQEQSCISAVADDGILMNRPELKTKQISPEKRLLIS